LAESVRAAGLLAISGVPLLILSRNQRRNLIAADSIRLSRTQCPEIYEVFEQMCARLGMDVPSLYLSNQAKHRPARAHTTWGHNHFVVLHPEQLERELEQSRDVFAFDLARELGRIRLGHTRWIDQMLLSYVIYVPFMRNPLLHVRTYSQDRYAACLVENCLPGLIIHASGRRNLPCVNQSEFVHQLEERPRLSARIAALSRQRPPLAFRIQALMDVGLLRPEQLLRSSARN